MKQNGGGEECKTDGQFAARALYFDEPLRAALLRAEKSSGRIEQVHLRCGGACEAVGTRGSATLLCGNGTPFRVDEEMLTSLLSRLCGGSLYQRREQLACGGFATQSGVRVGVLGCPVYRDGKIYSFAELRSICLRYAAVQGEINIAPALAALRGESAALSAAPQKTAGKAALRSVLFFGPPGSGKTTLLRALIRALSVGEKHLRLCVADFSGELSCAAAPDCHADFFTGYRRYDAVVCAQRFFAPQVIVCDEIGDEKDSEALLRTQHSGIALIATAHGDSAAQLLRRPGIAALWRDGVFSSLVRLFRCEGGIGCETEAVFA